MQFAPPSGGVDSVLSLVVVVIATSCHSCAIVMSSSSGAYRRQEFSRPYHFLRNQIAWRVLLCDFASFAFMMKFRGLSLLVCLWTIWTLSGHLTTYLMAIFGHTTERSPLIAVR